MGKTKRPVKTNMNIAIISARSVFATLNAIRIRGFFVRLAKTQTNLED